MKDNLTLDARNPFAIKKFFGITLLERTIKYFFLHNVQTLTILINPDQNKQELFNHHKLKHKFPDQKIELEPTDKPSPHALPANALYEHNDQDQPQPILIIDSRDKYYQAQKSIIKQVKRTDTGLLMYYLYGPIANFLSKLLSPLPITPNQVTFFNLLVGITSGFLLSQTDYSYLIAGAILYQTTLIIDSIDGELSRLRLDGTKYGAWFDGVCDVMIEAFPLIGLSIHLFIKSPSYLLFLIGLLLAFAIAFKTALLLYSQKLLPAASDLETGFTFTTNWPNFIKEFLKNPVKIGITYGVSYEVRRTLVLLGILLNLPLAVIIFFTLWYSFSVLYTILTVYRRCKYQPLEIKKWKKAFSPSPK